MKELSTEGGNMQKKRQMGGEPATLASVTDNKPGVLFYLP